MKHSVVSTFLIVTLSLLTAVEILPSLPVISPVVPSAHATYGGQAATIGLFAEAYKSNAVFDTSKTSGTTFVMDVNITGDGSPNGLSGGDIRITWGTPTVLSSATVSNTGTIFAPCGPLTTTGAGFVETTYVCPTLVPDNGVVERITFTVGSSPTTNIHVDTASRIRNPAEVPYQAIDGYFSNAANPANYSVSNTQSLSTTCGGAIGIITRIPTQCVSVVRPTFNGVTNVTLPSVAISVSNLNAGTASAVSLKVLSLPSNTLAVFSASSCVPNCSPTLQIQVNGGPTGGAATTPSGNFTLSIIGNVSTASGFLLRETWMRLLILPPHSPTFSVTASQTNFEQANGTSTYVTLTASLTCTVPTNCANDTVAWSSNSALGSTAGSASSFSSFTTCLSPSSCSSPLLGAPNSGGPFPLTTTMTISTPADTTIFGVRKFNVTTTDTGTYSESHTSVITTITITIVSVFLPTTISRNFAYSGISLAGNPIGVNETIVNSGSIVETSIPVTLQAKVALNNDPLLMFNDSKANGHWTKGDPVVYDTDNDGGVYDAQDTVVSGSPILGQALSTDGNIMFVDLHYNGVWSPATTNTVADPIAYESDCCGSSGLSDTGGFFDSGDTVISGAISTGYTIGKATVVTLGVGASNKVQLSWDPSALPKGKYRIDTIISNGTIGAEIWEASHFDAFLEPLVLLPFTQKLKGDVSGDCKVDIVDLSSVGATFGKNFGDVGFNPNADLNNDKTINIQDLVLVAGNFGNTC